MELTGKAKEAFTCYLKELRSSEFKSKNWDDLVDDEAFIKNFNALPDSFKFGVYVDWADSVGIDILIRAKDEYKNYQLLVFDPKDELTNGVWEESRPQARTAAVEKLNELFNNQN